MRDIPLNLLQIFAVCARRGSYTAAAGELHVTHSAVSQQMRRLEELIGAKLLTRQHDRMVLTEIGRDLHERTEPALRELRAAVAAVRADSRRATLRVTTIPSLATYWLVPRVAGFQAQHGTAVAIDTSTQIRPLSAQGYDVAIRHGRGEWPGCVAEKLFDEHLVAVCSPSYRGGDLPRAPDDLAEHRLLSYRDSQEWQQWAAKAGCAPPRPGADTVLSDAALMVSAALAGHGVAIGRTAIVLEHLRSGALVPLFGLAVPADYSYFLVLPADGEPGASLRLFVQWLRGEAERTRDELAALRLR